MGKIIYLSDLQRMIFEDLIKLLPDSYFLDCFKPELRAKGREQFGKASSQIQLSTEERDKVNDKYTMSDEETEIFENKIKELLELEEDNVRIKRRTKEGKITIDEFIEQKALLDKQMNEIKKEVYF